MLTLCGVPVTDGDARWLIKFLVADARPAAVRAASHIEGARLTGTTDVELSREEREALLAVLKNPPAVGLSELRDVLVAELGEQQRN